MAKRKVPSVKSREELEQVINTLYRLRNQNREKEAIDLLQQLQEETRAGTIRECLEAISSVRHAGEVSGLLAHKAVLALLPATQPQPEWKP